MGDGYVYHCDDCGKTYYADLGVGILYPQTCEEVLAAVRAGKYGQKLMEAAESEQYVGVAAEHKLYRCESCGNWDVYADASIYGLADKKKGPSIKFGEKTIAEWGEIPYILDEEKDYRLIEKYIPTCGKCGSGMHEKKLTKRLRLICPECGSPLVVQPELIRWD